MTAPSRALAAVEHDRTRAGDRRIRADYGCANRTNCATSRASQFLRMAGQGIAPMSASPAGATLRAMTERAKPDREERMLMPRSAPPAAVAPPRRPARSPEERAALAERVRDAREFATLEAQLRALGSDIDIVRRAARRAAASKGVRLLAHDENTPPRPRGEHVRLRDGAEIVIRQVEPEDAAQLKIAFERLGAVSRYRRFLAPLDHLTPKQLPYLTHVDHTSHEAIAALDAVTGGGIGVARFVRDPDDATMAEVAIVVTDAWQGRGVGTALAERLAARARAVGVQRITARMLVGNEAARRLIARTAAIMSEQRRSGTIALEARLTSPGAS
jgi:RimJ/RimL family protein N-acetyltransferase